MAKRSKDKKEKKTKRAKIDKDVPKRAIAAYFIYNQERRISLKKEKPELDENKFYKIICEEWNALSEEKKKPYIAKAEADKKKYDAEKKAYEKKRMPELKKHQK